MDDGRFAGLEGYSLEMRASEYVTAAVLARVAPLPPNKTLQPPIRAPRCCGTERVGPRGLRLNVKPLDVSVVEA
jgi:hypothetical protein